MDQQAQLQSLITIPTTFALVSQMSAPRNGEQVQVLRYQPAGQYQENGPRIIAIFDDRELLSVKALVQAPAAGKLSAKQARNLAEQHFVASNAVYAQGLHFMRVETQQREFLTTTGARIAFPVYWVKFAHQNGSYNWVTLAMDGTLIELEIDSRWDYFANRRATEMWDNDDWIKARQGVGPQLARPNALA